MTKSDKMEETLTRNQEKVNLFAKQYGKKSFLDQMKAEKQAKEAKMSYSDPISQSEAIKRLNIKKELKKLDIVFDTTAATSILQKLLDKSKAASDPNKLFRRRKRQRPEFNMYSTPKDYQKATAIRLKEIEEEEDDPDHEDYNPDEDPFIDLDEEDEDLF